MRTGKITLLVLLAVIAACKKKESGALQVESPELLQQASISDDSARAIALAQVPGGRITKAELEKENGVLIYSYDIKTAGQKGITEIHVDAANGRVLSRTQE